jgi:hypothetical protein
MLQRLYLFASAVVLTIAAYYFVNGSASAEAGCRRLIEKYDYGRKFPAHDDPMRERFVECWYIICGVKLDL